MRRTLVPLNELAVAGMLGDDMAEHNIFESAGPSADQTADLRH